MFYGHLNPLTHGVSLVVMKQLYGKLADVSAFSGVILSKKPILSSSGLRHMLQLSIVILIQYYVLLGCSMWSTPENNRDMNWIPCLLQQPWLKNSWSVLVTIYTWFTLRNKTSFVLGFTPECWHISKPPSAESGLEECRWKYQHKKRCEHSWT